MNLKAVIAGSDLSLAMALGGCASDGSLALSTGSINEDSQQQAKAQRIDPACVALMAKIDELRKEGTPERLAKVAAGKGKTASVKRDALARMTELDTANSEFQQKCSTLASPAAKPAAMTATAAAAQATPKPAAAAPQAAAPAATAQQTAAVAKSTAESAAIEAVAAAQ